MKGRVFWTAIVVGMVLGVGVEASAEIYLWTDERGVVHMTNQWATVPESARSHVVVRESSAAPREGPTAVDQPTRPVEPLTVKQPPLQMPSDLAQTPPYVALSPSVVPYPRASSMLIPSDRPVIHHPRKRSSQFPYNVRLDPVDPDFVWVGPNRVPMDTFTYPRVSLDQQAQFRDRIRTLEQRRSAPPKTFPTRPARP